MKNKIQLTIIIVVLIAAGLGASIYKHKVLGFSFLPQEKETIWTVEAHVTFKADGGPVTVSMNLPDTSDTISVLDKKSIAKGYDFSQKNGRAIWKKTNAEGKQKLFFRASAYRQDDITSMPEITGLKDNDPSFTGSSKTAAESIVEEALKGGGSPSQIAVRLITLFNTSDNTDASRLLNEADDYGGKLNLTRLLLNHAGINALAVKGLQLKEMKNKQKLKGYIEIIDNKRVLLINPRNAEVESRENFLIWQSNDESALEITGGSDGKLKFSALSGKMAAQRAALKHAKFEKNKLIDFSIYSLPISDQNTFKLLLLIPIGALVVVILRNLVGIATSGTFMPILISMVFLQTSLITGLGLFLLVVSVGLVLRSYLSHLNLLLVPRISAVLVFVIIIYVAISVVSIKMGIEAGLQVTFFPMIIISWTIERMSILWEEEGPKDVFVQGGGSLFSASLIYLAMKNKYIGHLTYSFPELLLVVLAVIIMIGSYSGYRLTELRRFEPLAKEG